MKYGPSHRCYASFRCLLQLNSWLREGMKKKKKLRTHFKCCSSALPKRQAKQVPPPFRMQKKKKTFPESFWCGFPWIIKGLFRILGPHQWILTVIATSSPPFVPGCCRRLEMLGPLCRQSVMWERVDLTQTDVYQLVLLGTSWAHQSHSMLILIEVTGLWQKNFPVMVIQMSQADRQWRSVVLSQWHTATTHTVTATTRYCWQTISVGVSHVELNRNDYQRRFWGFQWKAL